MLEYVDLATGIDDLKVPPSNRLHLLKENVKGNMQSRLTISGVFERDGPTPI